VIQKKIKLVGVKHGLIHSTRLGSTAISYGELGLNLEAECWSTFNETDFRSSLAVLDHPLNKKSNPLILFNASWLPMAVSTSLNTWKMFSSLWLIFELLYGGI